MSRYVFLDWYAIDHPQRLVVASDAAHATHAHLGRLPWPTRHGLHVHAGQLALHEHVDALYGRIVKFLSGDGAHRTGGLPDVGLCIACHDYLIERVVVVLQGDVAGKRCLHLDCLRLHAKVSHAERAASRYPKRSLAVHVGHNAHGAVAALQRRAWQWVAIGIHHRDVNLNVAGAMLLLSLRHGKREHQR